MYGANKVVCWNCGFWYDENLDNACPRCGRKENRSEPREEQS
jgi:rubrerythrin